MSALRHARTAPVAGWGLPYTFHPVMLSGYSVAAAANDAYYFRVQGSATISKIGVTTNAVSGNVSVGVFRGPAGGAPTTRLATSGAVACPTGYTEVSLGGSVTVDERTDWLAFSVDNITASFARVAAAGSESAVAAGFAYRGTTQHPLPAAPTGLTATVRLAVILIGRP